MIDPAKHLHAGAFLAGLVLSFAGLSAAGWMATERNLFADFHRFHQTNGAESQFYPTAREVAALTHDKLAADKIAVIIAGSSVMRGTGQSQSDLWSSYLQKELGDKFQVLNLAINGGGPGGQGQYMAEMLLKEGRKVIFLSDIIVIGIGMAPDNGPTFRGFYFDAESRGYLSNFPERSAGVSDLLQSTDPALLIENRIKAAWNRYLNFNDLWTTAGYRYFFTVWSPLTRLNPWAPRGLLPDVEPNCDPALRYKYYLDEQMAQMRGFANSPPLGDEVNASVAMTMPEPIKRQTLFVMNPYSPYYVDKLTPVEREKYASNVEKAAVKYQSLGIDSVARAPQYVVEDYCDRVHFSFSGGQKLAASLAPYIREKARDLGYE